MWSGVNDALQVLGGIILGVQSGISEDNARG